MKHALLILLTIIGVSVGNIHGLPFLPKAQVEAGDIDQQVARGKYLALAGNCASCHTVRGGIAYAGGRAIETPFGRVFSSNLTPDIKTGLGDWTANDFWQAMHLGKSKGGRLLYPAFPYPNYTKITHADADALFAYLKTLPPATQANQEHALRFPYNNQFTLAIWRALYFTPGVFQPDANQSVEWNRGSYLVNGLGHCNACHTSRDSLGGSNLKTDLAGGIMPVSNWYASSLTSDTSTGLGNWQLQDIADLLKNGISKRGAVYGPMSEVVYKSLQYLSDSDVQAMAVYLKSLPKIQVPSQASLPLVTKETMSWIMAWGAKVYKKHCVDCHGETGSGKPPTYQSLIGSSSLTMHAAANPIRMVLNGGYPPGTAGNPRPYGMPPFRPTLSDEEVAAVVSYIRNSWGNSVGVVTPEEVNRYRSAPVN
ncbi:MAG: cytochrome c [Gallionella sp.]